MWWASFLVGDLQFSTAVDNIIGFQTVQGLNLRVAGAVAQILLGNVSECIALDCKFQAI